MKKGAAPAVLPELTTRKMSRKTLPLRSLPVRTLILASLILLIPVVALAVPGSGEMVALHSESGREITGLYNLIAKIALGILILVEGVLLAAILKFRRRRQDERPRQNHGVMWLEAAWTLAALAIQVYIGAKTIDVMWEVETIPEDIEMTVEAIGYQWDWQFRYPELGIVSDDLVVPAHTKVKLEITSRDVIHSLFIPELGVKMDAVPGRFNYWWFVADGPLNQVRVPNYKTLPASERVLITTRPDFMQTQEDGTLRTVTGLEGKVDYLSRSRKVGEVSPYEKYSGVEYRGMCTELCGKGHWNMYFRAVVLSKTSFNRWIEDRKTSVTEANGSELYAAKCASCHGADGAGSGQFPKLAGSPMAANPDQKDAHITQILMGKNAMPAFSSGLNDAEIAAVTNYERISWGNAGGEVTEADVARLRETLGLTAFPAGGVTPTPGADLMKEGERLYKACASCHGAEGEGLPGLPPMANSSAVKGDVAALVNLLTRGGDTPRWEGEKTAVARTMSDFQLASILTYLRQSWGNDAGEVQPADVTRIRSGK